MAEIKTLVVDDDPQLLDIMERRLRKAGYEPDHAKDGRAALALIERTDYDLIVTDIYMPGATGLALLRKAKERDAHIQVVVVTAGATLDNAVEALNEGAFGYLSKPFDHISVFDNMVARALEFRRLILDNKRMAEAQKRRGDLLEEEVTDRVQQLRKRQRQLIDLLGTLPDGVVVVEEGGRVIMSSPAAEKWLAQELRSGGQPIQRFIEKVHGEFAEEEVEVRVGTDVLQLAAVELPSYDDTVRKVVIIREIKHESPDYAPRIYNPLLNLKKGLGWLYRHRKMGEVSGLLEYLALQVADIEKFTGLTIETDDQTEADISEMLHAEADVPAPSEVEVQPVETPSEVGAQEVETPSEVEAQEAEAIAETEAPETRLPAVIKDQEAVSIPKQDVEEVETPPELVAPGEEETLPGRDIVDFDAVDTEPKPTPAPEPVPEPVPAPVPEPVPDLEPEHEPEPPPKPKPRSAPLRRMFQKAAQIAKTKRLTEEDVQAAIKEGEKAKLEGQEEAFETLIAMLDEGEASTVSEEDVKKPEAFTPPPTEASDSPGDEPHTGDETSKDESWPPAPPSEE